MRIFFLISLLTALSCQSQEQSSMGSIKAWEVVINEIMADPDPAPGSQAYPEYVELYNKTNLPLSLKNTRFCVGTNCKTLPDASIQADSFLVLTAVSAVKLFPNGINVLGITGFPALTNAGQTIELLNDAGNVVHVISYTDNWYQDALKKEGGYSLEQQDAFNPCTEQKNWKACNHPDGGTPGRKNSVAVINKDKVAPQLLHVNVLSPDRIGVIFSEPLDSTTLLNTNSYYVSNIGHPKVINLIKPYYKDVVLELSDSLKKEAVYTLSVETQIRDCAGNAIDQENSIRFAIPETIHQNDIVINEVLFNPREGGVDFVEIYNRSRKTLDLKTLFLCHFDSVTHLVSDVKRISASSFLLFPGEYLVLTEDVEIVKSQYRTENAAAFLNVEVLPSMNTDAGNIALKTAGELIDQFAYREQMHFALLKETRGVSLERVHFGRFTGDVTNWHSASSSVDFATPGYRNSQFTDELPANGAVQIYPEIFSPDEDGVNDLVTIQYRFDEPDHLLSILIYDDQGRLVRTLVNNQFVGTEGSYSWDGINDHREKERKGMYIIYIQIMNGSETVNGYKKVCVLGGKN